MAAKWKVRLTYKMLKSDKTDKQINKALKARPERKRGDQC